MTRHTFLGLTSMVAVSIGSLALGLPQVLLASKGVEPNPATLVWVREVGVMILATGVTTFLARRAPDSLALRALLVGNAVLHFALLPIEFDAFARGVITKPSGVVPNSLLHLVFGIAFVTYALRVQVSNHSQPMPSLSSSKS